MNTGSDVESWFSGHDPALSRICDALRAVILDADPGLRESIKWGNPTYEKKGKVCYLAAGKGYVSLGFFDGASLTDPTGRIEGTGKRMRHLKVRAMGEIDRERFGAWIKEAVALDGE